jgi:hypothetical protein
LIADGRADHGRNFSFSDQIKLEARHLISKGISQASLSKRIAVSEGLLSSWKNQTNETVTPPIRLHVIEDLNTAQNLLSEPSQQIELIFPNGIIAKAVPWNSHLRMWLKELL